MTDRPEKPSDEALRTLRLFAEVKPEGSEARRRFFEALATLESELTARPKLEWRDPSTATRFAEVLVITIRGGFGRGRRRTNDWTVNGDAMNPRWIAGWLPLDALPPA